MSESSRGCAGAIANWGLRTGKWRASMPNGPFPGDRRCERRLKKTAPGRLKRTAPEVVRAV